MYLIHAQLTAKPGTTLPTNLRDLIRAQETPGATIEHVTPHPDAPHGPVLGLFVAATTLERAEQAAETACLRALETNPELAGLALVRCSAGFVAPFYEQGLQ